MFFFLISNKYQSRTNDQVYALLEEYKTMVIFFLLEKKNNTKKCSSGRIIFHKTMLIILLTVNIMFFNTVKCEKASKYMIDTFYT